MSNSKNYILSILVLIMPICGFAIDLYTPFLPKITELFQATDLSGKLSVSIYILGFGLGQILFGYRSDKQGRRKTLMESLVLFSVISGVITLATSILYFLILRFIQGIAVAGLVINVRAIVVDLYQDVALRKASIYITTAWMLSPIIAPAIGSYLYLYFTWHAAFYFLVIYACSALTLTYFLIPETSHCLISHSYKTSMGHYKRVFLSKKFMKNVYGLTIGFAVINLLNVVGPYLIEKQLGYSPLVYAYMILICGMACFVGSLLNTILLRYLTIDEVIKIALIAATLLGMIGSVISFYTDNAVYLIMIFCALIMCLIGAVYPNFSANCSHLFKEIAGIAAAVRGVITMIGAAMITGFVSLFQIDSVTAFLSIYSLLTIIALGIFIKSSKSTQSHSVEC